MTESWEARSVERRLCIQRNCWFLITYFELRTDVSKEWSIEMYSKQDKRSLALPAFDDKRKVLTNVCARIEQKQKEFSQMVSRMTCQTYYLAPLIVIFSFGRKRNKPSINEKQCIWNEATIHASLIREHCQVHSGYFRNYHLLVITISNTSDCKDTTQTERLLFLIANWTHIWINIRPTQHTNR